MLKQDLLAPSVMLEAEPRPCKAQKLPVQAREEPGVINLQATCSAGWEVGQGFSVSLWEGLKSLESS